MAYQPQSGSVVAFQGNPSVLQVLATVTNPVNISSVSGTVGASVIGTVPVTQVTTPWNVAGSVAAFLNSTNASVITVGSPVANQSVSGTVGASVIGTVPVTQSGTVITSLVSTAPSSVLVGASIFGQLPGGTAVLGSVATLQGTNPWITRFANSSIIAINAGSVVALSQGSVISVTLGSVAAAQVGTWRVSILSQVAGTSSTYAVRTSISAVSIMSANVNRRGGTIYNNSSTVAFVQLGTVVTTSMYTVKMVDQSYYELPFGYTGVVGGITASNAGVLTVTELT